MKVFSGDQSRHRSSRWRVSASIAVMLAASASWASPPAGQPPAPQPAPPASQPVKTDGARPDEGEIRREMLRKRLAERAEELRAEQQKVIEALAAVDEGKPVEEIIGALPRAERRGEWWRDARSDDREEGNERDGPRPGGPPRPLGAGESDSASPRRDTGRGSGGGPDGEGAGVPWRSDDERRAFMDFLKEAQPEIAERLLRAERESPERFREMVSRVPKVREVMRMLRENPEHMPRFARTLRLDREARGLAHRAAHGPEGERESSKAELARVVDQLFDARIEVTRFEIDGMQKRIAAMTQEIESHTARRAQVVEERVSAMIKDALEHAERDERRGERPGAGQGPGAGHPGTGAGVPRDHPEGERPQRPGEPGGPGEPRRPSPAEGDAPRGAENARE